MINKKTFFKNINCWQDFDDKLSSLGNKDKGDAFELLTKCYFNIKEIYQDYDNVWLLDKLPQKELDYLKIPSQDLGIDLIAKKGDEYHAIQCKYHGNSSQNITFKEVSTFLQQVESNKKITMGYICSSANGTSKNYQKVQKKDIQEILADSWQLLDKAFFDNVRRILNDKPIKNAKPFEPRKHQEKAINQAVNHFVKENNARGKLIFPCGAGKSLTGYWLSEALESKSTIIAVPSLSLVKQTLEVYLREIVANGIKVKWLCICSDEGIGASDDVAIMTNNIGVPCKTDPEYIRAWLKENKDEHKIIFTTYQSGQLIADISKKLKISFDLGIFDEAHKTVGSNLKKFSYLLFEKNIKIDKRIFMTATERFYKGSKDDIISMDDEDVYGDTFAQMSFKEAIDLDLLTDYKIITIDIKKSEIADFIRQNDKVQLNDKWKKVTEARSLAAMLTMRKAMKQFNIKNVVSFHSSIERAKRSKELQEHITDTYNYMPIDTYTVSGKIPTTKRNVIVQEFAKSERALITNARCLTEGIDVPNIDCIVFADPKKSKVDIVQALGRALRKKEGKEWGYVILPVVYDGDTNEIDNDSFNGIINIVRGLAANDERIVEYFKDKAPKGKGSGEMIKGSDIFSFDSSMLEEKDLANQLQIKIWEKLSRFNWLPFEEAREIVQKERLSSYSDWRVYSKDKRPYNIPANVNEVYKDKGWHSWGDFLGTGIVATSKREYIPFKEAREFARKLNCRKLSDWYKFSKNKKISKNIPTSADRYYEEKGWKGWGDFLGIDDYRGHDFEFLPFEEARKIVRSLALKNTDEWYEYCQSERLPNNIPNSPEYIYKDKGWKGIGDWIGTGRIADQFREYLTFENAKRFMLDNNIKSMNEWRAFRKENNIKNIPYKLTRTYSKEWVSSPHFFSTANFTYKEAKKFIQKFNIASSRDYFRFCKTKDFVVNLPQSPGRTYKDKGWVDWKEFLGYTKRKTSKKQYATLKEAKNILHPLQLLSSREYSNLLKDEKFKNNHRLPTHPDRIYKDEGWEGMQDYLGYSDDSRKKKFVSYEECKRYAIKLGISTAAEWSKLKDNRPDNIPASPPVMYKDKGWNGWKDFLGKD